MPRFNDRFIAGLKVEGDRKDKLVFDDVVRGLGIRITRAGSRGFVVQWTDPATRRKVREPIGTWGNITVEQARAAARAKLGAVAAGINPKMERQRQRAEAERERAERALTFAALIDDWAALHLAYRREGYAAEAVRAIKFALPELMSRPASRITKADAINALDRLVKAGKTTTAARTRAYASACFGWAVKRGKLCSNPFAQLPIVGGHNQRDRVLSADEARAIWTAAGELPSPGGAFIRMALLTLQRRSEVGAMRWSEIQGNTWRIPAERMKRGQPHTVHLSQPALDILTSLPRIEGNDFVFVGERSGIAFSSFAGVKERLDKLLPEMPGWTLHDFRRCGVSWLAETGFDSAIVDRILAHNASGLTIVGRTYQRAEHLSERARALDAWGASVSRSSGNAENVVRLHEASR